jgi:hypothetical protein
MAFTLIVTSYPLACSMRSSCAGHASEVETPRPFVLLAPSANILVVSALASCALATVYVMATAAQKSFNRQADTPFLKSLASK